MKTAGEASGRITWRIALNMMTPGAILLSATAPAVLGILCAIESGTVISPLMAVLLIWIPSLMNASVNVLNDYYDYVRGNDTAENIVSEDDGPLAYHHVTDAKPAWYMGLLLLGTAALPGVYVVVQSGPLPAVIGLIGGVILVTYSGGHLSTSYLPIGEVLSGFTMGGLITLGVYAALTGRIDGWVLYKSVPMMLIVSQFMLDNNTCDMERDQAAGRKTLPMLIGREKAQQLSNVITVFWVIQLLHVVGTWYRSGIWVTLAALWIGRRAIKGTFRERRVRDNKIPATAAQAGTAISIAVGYLGAVVICLVQR